MAFDANRQDDLAERIVAEARGWMNTPYGAGIAQKDICCDAYGFVKAAVNRVAGDFTLIGPYIENSLPSAETQGRIVRVETVLPGDIIHFSWKRDRPTPLMPPVAHHVAIATGDDRFMHAFAGRAVTESWLSRWWKARITAIYRINQGAEQ